MTPFQPLSKTEMKMLIFNKMKHKSMTYDDARAELTAELGNMFKSHSFATSAKREEGENRTAPSPNLKIKKAKLKQKLVPDDIIERGNEKNERKK